MQDAEKTREQLIEELILLRRHLAEVKETESKRGIGQTPAHFTDHRSAEEIRRESEEKYRLAMEAISDGLWDWDCRTGRVYYSPACCRMLGEDRVPPVFDSWENRIHVEERDEVLKSLKDHLEGKSVQWQREFRLYTHLDGWKWILGRGRVVARNDAGAPLRMVGTMVDISERKQDEEALRESEHRYRELLETGSDAILFVDSDTGLILEANGTASAMLGYGKEELLTKRDWELSAEPQEARHLIQGAKTAPGQGIAAPLRYLRRKDGGTFPAEITGRSFSWQKRPVFIAAIRDISERKRSEESLKEQDLRFNKLSLHVPGVIYQFMKRPDGTYCAPFATESVKESFGCSPQDIREDFSPAFRAVLPEDLGRLIESIESSAEQLTTWQCEYRVQVPGRPIRWMFGQSTPEKLDDGSIMWHGFSTDITELKQAEEALQASEREKTILNEIANVFLTIPDERIYEEVLSVVLKRMQSDYGVFGFISETGDLVIPSMTREIWSNCQIPEKSIIFPVHSWGNSLWGRAIREQQPFHSDGPFLTPEGHVPIDNFLTTPVIFGSKTIGLLSVANKNGGYTEEDTIRMGRIANAISPILHMRLERDRQHREKEWAEKALRDSSVRFESQYQGIPVPTLTWQQKEGSFVLVNYNRAAMTLTNGEIVAYLGRMAGEMYPDRPDILRDLHLCVSQKQMIRKETISEHFLPGRDIVLTLVFVPSDLVMTHMEDVTEHKQAEQERKRAETELLREKQFAEKLLESLPGIFFLYDSTCHLKRWNKAHETAMGFTADELRDWYIPDWHETPGEAAIGMAFVKSVLDTGVGGAFETTLINKEGRFVPYLISVTRLMTPDGPAMMGVGLDITERRRAEEERQKSEKSYQLLVKNIPAVVYKGYVDGTVEFLDNKIQAVIGYSMEDFASGNLKWFALIHPDDMTAAKRSFVRALRGEREYIREYRVKRQDGQYAWVQERSQIVCDGEGRIDYISGVLFDVGERKRSEEEKEKLEAQFSQAQKMEAIGRLAGGVAHDFNNMLSVISGYTELALAKLRPIDPIHGNLKAVQEAANRSADLTRQLLAFSRKQTISPRVVDLNEQTRSMERLLTRIIGEDINLTLNLSPGLWPVYMDPAQVDQIVANLAVNSRDAMPKGGKLTVETANTTLDADFCKRPVGLTPGDFVMMAVSDTGCGIGREMLDHVFEPFFTTKPEGKGTGLGLATVYGIAKQNNGSVFIYSELDRGTTVRIYLPRYVGHDAVAHVPLKESRPKGGWETILLVEDEGQIRELAKTILETLGYQVLEASGPGEAVVLCERHPRSIHLLLTDMVMPNMNGKELADKIRAMKPGVRTLFMSGYSGDILAQHGVFDEAFCFLQKPFSVKSLAEKVREVLDG